MSKNNSKPPKTAKNNPSIQGISKKGLNSILIGIVILLFLSIIFVSELIAQWGNLQVQEQVSIFSTPLKKWVSDNSQMVNILADSIQNEEVILKDHDKAVSYLGDIVSRYPQVYRAYIIFPFGERIAVSNEKIILETEEDILNAMQQRFYTAAMESGNGTSISDDFYIPGANVHYIAFSRVLYDKSGESAGVLSLFYDLDNLYEILEEGLQETKSDMFRRNFILTGRDQYPFYYYNPQIQENNIQELVTSMDNLSSAGFRNEAEKRIGNEVGISILTLFVDPNENETADLADSDTDQALDPDGNGNEGEETGSNRDDYMNWDNVYGFVGAEGYDIAFMASETEPESGMIIVSVMGIFLCYGLPILFGMGFIIILYATCMILYKIIIKVVLLQEETSSALEKESERASQADRAKSTFLAQMSHEIRTPINAVLGMNELILRESGEENIQEYASNAYNSGKALLAIINDVLDISKIEAGKMEIVESEYELYSLIVDCYHMTLDRAQKKGLTFLCNVEETLPAKLSGDMFHIRQIVVNFITNAIKYSDSGTVELNFAGERNENGFLLNISVKDTGIGLKPESMEKLFSSFSRFDLERNQSVEGTGLGLSICKQLAELMNGTVTAESEYGKGATFICSVPQNIVDDVPIGKVTPEHANEKQTLAALAKFQASDAHVLVVDDVEMNLLVFEGLLKGHDLKIDKAISGKQCLDLVKDNKYDVIFMDHMMPEMDGMETLENMKKMEHLNKETPVIMLTANAISGEQEKYLEAGFVSYLTKPVQGEKLTKALLNFLPDDKIIWEQTDKTPDMKEPEIKEQKTDELFDPNLGLQYLDNDRETYVIILKSYLNAGKERSEKLRKYCIEEAWKDYVTEVHALKSTSLSIGSKLLSSRSAELEQAGKTGNYEMIKEQTESLLALYEQVLSFGRNLLEEWGSAETDKNDDSVNSGEERPLQELTKDQLKEYRDRIAEAAGAFDSDGILSICEEFSMSTYQGKRLKESVQKVMDAASDFEYEKAVQEMDLLIAQISD